MQLNFFVNIYALAAGLAAFLLHSCGLEREVDIELPPYSARIVVEGYLEPGRPYSLLLTRSAPFFEPFPDLDNEFFNDLLVSDAEVEITHRGQVIRLANEVGVDRPTRKVYNYRSRQIVPADFEAPFDLDIRTAEGETIRSSTRLLPPVPIDSVVVEFQAGDTLARVLTYLTDPGGVPNYYRRVLHRSSLDSLPEQDFSTDDRFIENLVVFGTDFKYAEGDTLINTIYHIEEPYFDFLQTVGSAAAANGNPFVQPSPVQSNLEGSAGAIGIFTGITYDRLLTIIRK